MRYTRFQTAPVTKKGKDERDSTSNNKEVQLLARPDALVKKKMDAKIDTMADQLLNLILIIKKTVPNGQ